MEMFFPSVIIISEKKTKKHYVQSVAETVYFDSTVFPASALSDGVQCNFMRFS